MEYYGSVHSLTGLINGLSRISQLSGVNTARILLLISLLLIFKIGFSVCPADTIKSDSVKAWKFTSLNMLSINKVFSSVFYLHLKYDHNTNIPTYETVDGENIMVSDSPKLQLKESFGLSLTYKI